MLAIDWTGGIEEAWDDLVSAVPKILGALVILVVGWIIAKLIYKVLITVLHKVKFDDLMDRSGIGAPLERAGFADSGVLLAKLLYYGIMLLVLQLAIGVFGESAIKDSFDSLIAFIPKIFVALVIVVITGVIANAVRALIAPEGSQVASMKLMGTVAFVAIWIIGGFAALDQIDIAKNVVSTLFSTIMYSLGLILVIKFGVGGIWAARDHFWPKVYKSISTTFGLDDK
ncbi:MAG: hypothetical protein CSA55_05850 [Ilumatobacter coccineus]|uniref:Transporter n=1 Tax=Ilumatobacter coccineus TaxID=467094 RepID=A0A2G6K7L5_9ACTN|nr:MAG: hypothetical protein CSA55_05850 [Ilumatobacter coccineus]